MSKETNKPKYNPLEELIISMRSLMKEHAESLSIKFNTLSKQTKQVILIACGIIMAGVCTALILQAVYGNTNARLSIDEIAIPNNIYMSKPEAQKLTPIGKMKGELDGEFEAFHVAIDGDGQLFINRDPEFSKDSLNKSKGWEPITRPQLEAYEKQLHFIPHRKNGLKH